MKRPRKPTGFIVYRGPSLLDGAPIVVIAVMGKSSNSKTGPMIQTYILRDDVHPIAAVKAGLDSSICGDCVFAGGRGCYVKLHHGPASVYRCFERGGYPDISADPETVAALGVGRKVRLGAYGDPAAAPVAVWRAITSKADGWTGYTHQWRHAPLAGLCMASVDSAVEQIQAMAEGWRTFRVRTSSQELNALEIVCPASKEAGKRTLCDACLLCRGTSLQAKSIAIVSHGSKYKRAALAILTKAEETRQAA